MDTFKGPLPLFFWYFSIRCRNHVPFDGNDH